MLKLLVMLEQATSGLYVSVFSFIAEQCKGWSFVSVLMLMATWPWLYLCWHCTYFVSFYFLLFQLYGWIFCSSEHMDGLVGSVHWIAVRCSGVRTISFACEPDGLRTFHQAILWNGPFYSSAGYRTERLRRHYSCDRCWFIWLSIPLLFILSESRRKVSRFFLLNQLLVLKYPFEVVFIWMAESSECKGHH